MPKDKDIESNQENNDVCACERSTSVCNDALHFISVKCSEYCTVSEEDLPLLIQTSADSNESELSGESINDDPFIQILPIGSRTEDELFSVYVKYSIKCILIVLLLMVCIINGFYYYSNSIIFVITY